MKTKLSAVALALLISTTALASEHPQDVKKTSAQDLAKSALTTPSTSGSETIFTELTVFSYVDHEEKGAPAANGNYEVKLHVGHDWEGVEVVRKNGVCIADVRRVTSNRGQGGWIANFRDKPTMIKSTEYVSCDKYLKKANQNS